MSRKVWTAAELDQMTPAAIDDLFEASIVEDGRDIPEGHLARVRERVQARIDNEAPFPR